MPDQTGIGGAGRFEVSLSLDQVADRPRQAGLGLADVSARHLADLEAVAGGFEFVREHLHIALVQLHQRLIAQHVEIGPNRAEQYLLFDRPQLIASHQHVVFGLANAGHGASAAVEFLRK